MATKKTEKVVKEVKPKTVKVKKVKVEEAPKSWLEEARERANAKYNK